MHTALVVAFVTVFVGLFVWIIVAGRRQAADREALEQRERGVRERRARDLGWRYDSVSDGDIRYRFEGATADGQRWSMKFDSDASSSSSSPKLVWTAAGVAASRLELMIDHRSQLEGLTTGTARKMIGAANFVLGRVVGASLQDLHAFAQDAHVQVASPTKADSFAVAARDAGFARALLRDADLLRLLATWPSGLRKGLGASRAVSAKLDRDGLTVTLRVDAPPMAACEQLARLGEALAARLREARFVGA
jgi:hypothetical protein